MSSVKDVNRQKVAMMAAANFNGSLECATMCMQHANMPSINDNIKMKMLQRAMDDVVKRHANDPHAKGHIRAAQRLREKLDAKQGVGK